MNTQTLVFLQVLSMLVFGLLFIFEQVAKERRHDSSRFKKAAKVTSSPFYFLTQVIIAVIAAGFSPDKVFGAISSVSSMMDAHGFGLIGLLLVLAWCAAYVACFAFAAVTVMLLAQGGIVDIFTAKRFD